MSTKKLSNISYKMMRKFLSKNGFVLDETCKGRGGHEKWTKKGLLRPVGIQNHISPVPERIVKQIILSAEMTKKEFLDAMDKL